MSEYDKDYVYNLLTNTSRFGTKLLSAIYLVGATKTNGIPDDLKIAACYHNYYSILAHDEISYADTEIIHPNQKSLSVPSTGGNVMYDADTNRAADVDDFL